ncbi:hypothetical protein [Glaciecola sp. SC05]|uniref:hypothetical protein n=1 Tax=Glaciecola sp. SC05 TaxID=1987355 RepID=UPI0035285C95
MKLSSCRLLLLLIIVPFFSHSQASISYEPPNTLDACEFNFNAETLSINEIATISVISENYAAFEVSKFSIFALGKATTELVYHVQKGGVLKLQHADRKSNFAISYTYCGHDDSYFYVRQKLSTQVSNLERQEKPIIVNHRIIRK